MQTTSAVALCLLISTVANGDQQARVVTVSAQSEIRVTPDEAIIAFSVSTQDKALLTAKADNDSLTTEIVKAVKSLEVAAEDFKVTNLDIGRRHEHGEFVGYGVDRSFEIRTTDFAKIDRIIGGLVDAGGDSVSISELKLQVRDQRKHQVEARRLAVEYARDKAVHLAELNQMKLGAAISITEDVEYNGNTTGFGMGGGMTRVERPSQSRMAALPQTPASTRVPQVVLVSTQREPATPAVDKKKGQAAEETMLLSPGQVSLNAVVTIEFELLPK